MLWAVLDTNIFISALFGGAPEDAYRAALRRRYVLLTSPAILTELARVLREKFGLSEPEITAYVRQIGRRAEIVRPAVRLTVARDEADNRILECAVEGKADVVVSGDRDLLRLKEHAGIPVVRPIDFLRALGPV